MPAATLPPYSERVSYYTYLVAFGLCMLLTVVAVRRIPAVQRGPWNLLLLSSAFWATGEVYTVVAFEQGWETYPSLADLVYFFGYFPMAMAVLRLDRKDIPGRRSGSLLDAAIVSLSVATLAVTFLVQPVVSDSSQPLLVRAVSSVYPLIDVMLVYLIARLLGGDRTRTRSVLWLATAMISTLTADVMMNVQSLSSLLGYTAVQNLLWLAFYLFTGFAAMAIGRPSRQAERQAEVRAEESGVDLGALRLAVLTFAAMLPSLVIITYGSWDSPDLSSVVQLGVGSAFLISLVAVRIWGLIRQLRRQAWRLDVLAATDPLTKVANRRTWDAQMSSTMLRAQSGGEPGVLLVALLDLDHFKEFNDSHGHQAGDDLLRRTALEWQDVLGPEGLLARWGGEEFAVLLRAEDEIAGLARLDALRRVVPEGRTVSLGVSRWDGRTPPGELMLKVDQALYEAKARGRNRMVVAGDSGGPGPAERPRPVQVA
ncbi:GGDEF domain-containing protein [Kineosporia sp. NBRC 101677]|uniref:GGDEF domain-containing protein n=1 Tax=Kineosporia sp. NBRC 101677 TaxID=3032197 RepID=UPI0025539998|nr:GGDEF domain-containing protein [Kineosporia sp. NBRC 101677]